MIHRFWREQENQLMSAGCSAGDLPRRRAGAIHNGSALMKMAGQVRMAAISWKCNAKVILL
jgi:hypothetical protein